MKARNVARDLARCCTALGLTLVLPGCTTLYEGKYDFRDGWRQAKVTQVLPASQLERPEFFACVRRASANQRANEPFLILTYKKFLRTAERAIVLPQTPQLTLGETVYVNISSCDGPVAKRGS